MTLLPSYTFLIRNRNARRRQLELHFPHLSDDERHKMLVAKEYANLALEIPPYIADLHARMEGYAPIHSALLDGTMYLRCGIPAYCMLFQDTDGLHRIVSFS